MLPTLITLIWALHRHSTVDASHSSSWISATIGDGVHKPSNRLYTSPMFTRTFWNIGDVSATCLALVYLTECCVHYCALLSAVRRYIADGSWRWNIGRKFQCNVLVKHGDYSRTSLIICRTTGAWWRCTNLCDFFPFIMGKMFFILLIILTLYSHGFTTILWDKKSFTLEVIVPKNAIFIF